MDAESDHLSDDYHSITSSVLREADSEGYESSADSLVDLAHHVVGEDGAEGGALELDEADGHVAIEGAEDVESDIEAGPGEITVRLNEDPNGPTLVWYKLSRTFYAYCKGYGHGPCRCNRKSRPGRRKAQGRPLGFLYWWVMQGHRHDCQMAHLHDCAPSRAQRREFRDRLKLIPGTAILFRRERQKFGDESDSELEDVP